ncbi:MAG: hypothetical protein ACRDPJ_13350 [Nocardioidaceae bacterium]
MAAAVVLVDPASSLEASPDSSVELVAQALTDNADSALAGAWCGLAGVLLLAVFFARLHGVLRAAAGPDSWLPQVALLGASAFLAMQLVSVGFAFAASDTDSFAENPQVAMMIMVFGWYFPAVYAPCLAAVMASVTAVALMTEAFPTWFAWAAAALLAGIVMISALGAAGMAAAVGFLGLLVVAAVITFHREESALGPDLSSITDV